MYLFYQVPPDDPKPARFVDSPQHYSTLSTIPANMASTSSGFVGHTLSNTSGLGSNYTNTSGLSSNLSTASGLVSTHGTQPPTPSPRRKSSSTSNEGDLYVNYRENFNAQERVPGIYVPGEYHNPSLTEYPESNGPQYVGHFTSRSELYRNPEAVHGLPPTYNYDRVGTEYIMKHRNPENYAYTNYSEFGPNLQHNYEVYNPESYESPISNRTPLRLPYGAHRRTNSNVSNASSTNTSSSNVNQGFRMDGDESLSPYVGQYFRRNQNVAQKTPEKREREYEFTQNKQITEYSWKTSEYSHSSHSREYFNPESTPGHDRPGTLGLELGSNTTKLRSSLKKYNSQKKGGSGAGTPTNPTPPDSLTSEDSSYVSAKDSSGSGSRVRFSPEALSEHGPSQHQNERRPSRHT